MATTKQRASSSRNGARTRQQQAERFARQSREKIDERREKASGAAGWIADRAGQWDLEAQDYRFMELQKFLWNPLIDYWFRMEVDGWENIPGHRYSWSGSTPARRSSGTRGRSASTGGGASGRSARCTARPMTR